MIISKSSFYIIFTKVSSEDPPERSSIWDVLRSYKQKHKYIRNGKRESSVYDLTESNDHNIDNVFEDFYKKKLKQYEIIRWLKKI